MMKIENKSRFDAVGGSQRVEAKQESNDYMPPSKLDFGKIGKKTTAKTKAKAKPVVPDPDGELAPLADYIAETGPLVKPFASAKKQLGEAVLPHWFSENEGKIDPATTMAVKGTDGTIKAEVSMVNRYSRVEDIPDEEVRSMFRQTFGFAIDGDAIPANAAQAVVNDLQEVLAKHGCLDAMSVTSGFLPVPEFHAKRHLVLTPERNMALNKLVPVQARVK